MHIIGETLILLMLKRLGRVQIILMLYKTFKA